MLLSMLNKLGASLHLEKSGMAVIADTKIFHFGTLSMTNLNPVRVIKTCN